jgi:hypothetical protein
VEFRAKIMMMVMLVTIIIIIIIIRLYKGDSMGRDQWETGV